jgi:dihydroflavonol-4-reductase
MPGVVYGPGDHSLVGQLMEAWHRGLFPVFPGPETIYTYAHVEDIVEGHLLAAEKGKPGESYILAGPAMNLKEMAQLWARLSGKQAPLAYLPSAFLHPMEPIARMLGGWIPGWPELLSADAIAVMGKSYAARADKARRELGWELRPLEEGMRETLDWIARKTESQPLLTPRQKRIGGLALAAALLLLFRPRKTRRRK